MTLEVQNNFCYKKTGGFLSLFLALMLGGILVSLFPGKASAWSTNDCMNSASSVFGSNVLNVNYDTFY